MTFLIPWFFLAVQTIILISSLLGFGIFTTRPDLLAQVDPGARFFTWAFYGFAIINMVAGGLAVVTEACQRNRLRVTVLALGAVYLASLGSELMGTTSGIPFGAYAYTELLGPKWFGHVPLVIPLSWVTMAWPAWVLARHRTSGSLAIAVGASLLVAWDLVLDPAMSSVTSYWVWGETGSYYGMPWSNVFGWALTGLLVIFIFAKLMPEPQGSRTFALAVYGVNLALPLGFCILRGYWIAVAAGIASVLAALFLVALGRQQNVSSKKSQPTETARPFAV